MRWVRWACAGFSRHGGISTIRSRPGRSAHRRGKQNQNMAMTLGQLGRKKAIAQFADWTDRIAAGELPSAKPQRPQGVERNVVISMWEWSTPKAYLHDEISTDKRNPRAERQWPDLRFAGRKHGHGSRAQSDHERNLVNQASLTATRTRRRRSIIPTATRFTGTTSRFGTATRPFTIRTSTIRDAFGSPRASAPRRITRTTAKRVPIFPRPRWRRWTSVRAPALHVRSENRKIFADRHVLQHAASLLRP